MSVSLCLLANLRTELPDLFQATVVVLLVRGVMTLTSSTNGGQHEYTHNFVQICLQTIELVATFLKRGACMPHKVGCAQSAPVSSV